MLIACLEKSKFVCYRQRGRREPVHRGGSTNEMRRESPLTVLQIIQICLGNTQPRRRLPLRPAFGEPSRAEFVSFHRHFDNMLSFVKIERTFDPGCVIAPKKAPVFNELEAKKRA